MYLDEHFSLSIKSVSHPRPFAKTASSLPVYRQVLAGSVFAKLKIKRFRNSLLENATSESRRSAICLMSESPAKRFFRQFSARQNDFVLPRFSLLLQSRSSSTAFLLCCSSLFRPSSKQLHSDSVSTNRPGTGMGLGLRPSDVSKNRR